MLKNKLKTIKNLKSSDIDTKSLYIHIPFCEHICHYCDFTKVIYKSEIAFSYVSKIIDEIEFLESFDKKFKTIYIGGGTPTSLSISDLERLLKSLNKLVDFSKKYEFTVEANVENLTENKLVLLKKYGVNRLSIGTQSFNDKILKRFNRFHTGDEAISTIKLAQKYIKNINVDLIYAVPFSSVQNLEKDLEIIANLNIKHVSLYSLQINKGTKFFVDKIEELNEDDTRNQYDFIVNFLKKHGFIHYEVSNFARKGYESKHNKVYWKDQKYLALGAGASGYIKNIRYTNTKNILSYINKEEISEIEYINKEKDFEYYLITNLRLLNGLNINKLNRRFGINFILEHKNALEKLEKLNLITYNENTLKCTENGIFVLDSIILELLK